MEAGAEDDRVDLALGAVGGHDRVRADLPDAVRDQLDVRLRERRIPLVRGQDALAAELVARRQPGAQLRVGHLLRELAQRHAGRQPAHALVAELQHERLARPVDPGAHRQLGRGEAVVELALQLAHGPVGVRHDPRRRALEDVHPPHLGLDPGDELDRRGAGADHGHALAGEVVVVVPARGVEGRAREVLEAGQVGHERLRQRPLGGDQHVGAERPLRGLDQPAGLGLVPPGRLQLGLEPDVRERRRSGRPRRAGRRGSRAGARRCSTSSGWGRRRRSRGATGRRSGSRDRCCRARCRPPRRPARAARSRGRPRAAA